MIVKNEASIILRCIESMRPLLDYVLIVDTGSTDGTQDIVKSYLRDTNIPGEVVDEPWKDFASNRSSALARLRQCDGVDYALIMDADDMLICEHGFDPVRFKASMTADSYNLTIRLGPVTYHRPQICSNRLPFRYRGVLHEFLELPPPAQPRSEDAIGLSICSGRDGARGLSPDKYKHDADVLEQALAEQALAVEQDSLLVSRYTFYLAQSYRDFGDLERALPLYLRRAEQRHWHEEVFMSLYEAARITDQLQLPDTSVIGLFLKAYELCPERAESLHGAMMYCRFHSFFHQGYLIGKQAVTLVRPVGGLFLQDWIYEYGLFDEFSVLAYWSGHYKECRQYSERILSEGKIPAHERQRISDNVRFAEEKLAQH